MNKLKSVKTLALIWACAFITYVVIADKVDFNNIAFALTAVPISYSYFNIKQKELFSKEEK